MRSRKLAPAILCLALVLGAFTGVAVAGKASSEVSIDSVTVNADGSGHYEGTVKSSKEKCKKKRKVKVIHLSDPPFTIGATTTDDDGFWQLNGPLPPGGSEKIKVEVKRSTAKKCKGASKTYTLNEVLDD